jgi:hypothetical protein
MERALFIGVISSRRKDPVNLQSRRHRAYQQPSQAISEKLLRAEKFTFS